MEYLLYFRSGYIYSFETNTLHTLIYPGMHLIRRPVKLDYWGEYISIFNAEEESYWFEVTSPDGRNVMWPHYTDPIYVLSSLLRVKM